MNYPITLYLYNEIYYAWYEDLGFSTCSGCGDTAEEALKSLEENKKFVLEHMKEMGDEIPEATMPDIFKWCEKEKEKGK